MQIFLDFLLVGILSLLKLYGKRFEKRGALATHNLGAGILLGIIDFVEQAVDVLDSGVLRETLLVFYTGCKQSPVLSGRYNPFQAKVTVKVDFTHFEYFLVVYAASLTISLKQGASKVKVLVCFENRSSMYFLK